MSENIKKYPIFYQGEEYEIRIEKEKEFNPYGWVNFMYVNIYEVSTYKYYLLGQFPIGKDKKEYTKVYSISLDSLEHKLYDNNSSSKGKLVCSDSDDYYIELFKLAFEQYIKPLKIKEKQLAALENWNGVIE